MRCLQWVANLGSATVTTAKVLFALAFHTCFLPFRSTLLAPMIKTYVDTWRQEIFPKRGKLVAIR